MLRSACIYGMSLALLGGGLAAPAQSAERFSLGKAVPEGVYILVQAANNPERAAINERWGKIWQAVADARLQDDVRDMIRGLVEQEAEEDLETFDKVWETVAEVIDGVEWDKLASKEFVYAGRMGFPISEHVWLARGDEAAKNFAGLRRVFVEVQKASEGKVTFEDSEEDGTKLVTVTIPIPIPIPDQKPFKIQLAHRGDVVAVGFSQTLLDQALALLAAGGEAKGLTATARFKKAFTGLPDAEDSMVFFDVNQLFQSIRGIFKTVGKMTGEDGDAAVVMAVLDKAIATFDIFEHVAVVETTEDDRAWTHTLARLKPGGADTPFGKVLTAPAPKGDFARFIPKEATGFSVSRGFDISAAYKMVTDFVKNNVPDGEQALEAWAEVQKDIGFNLHDDLLSWVGTESVNVSLPSAVPALFSQADWVLMLHVRDPEKAAKNLNTWVDKLEALLAENDQELLVADADVKGAKGFRSVTHAFIQLFLKPVYGVAEDRLIISNSPQAIATCLATARGEHPSIRENARVKKEGLLPEGALTSVSFTDQRNLGKEIAGALGAASMGIGMMSAMVPEPEAKAILGGITKILGKLTPIVAQIDFLNSQAAAITFDGKAWRTTQVTTYNLSPEK